MCDEFIHPGLIDDARITRRTFGLIAVAAAGAAQATAPKVEVDEKDVLIKTPDGTADAALFTPAKAGTYPAVLMWPDIMGLRPAFRDMGRRLAGEGYVVLVPNPFYRSKKAPVLDGPINFSDPKTREILTGYRKAITSVPNDAKAFLAFLDTQPKTNKRRKAGVQGYCMSGPFAIQTAATLSDRIGAVATFHGGGMATKDPDSPHLLIPKTKARFLIVQAQNDDAKDPETKVLLKEAFAAAKRPATVEVYPADHGWTVPGSQVYDAAQAERAWSALLQLYRVALT
ncbi:dienelactone hydrolase family protein [Sphingomonas flavescens]|uniref:dienelactone hydrolase family protein n=1 Tax=Sphingomonas flavescens TaxID=3132797 RepID=UPI002804A9F9|nr:dienelactone hydrolase family protein [Sphingomonas limnosediminicola]